MLSTGTWGDRDLDCDLHPDLDRDLDCDRDLTEMAKNSISSYIGDNKI